MPRGKVISICLGALAAVSSPPAYSQEAARSEARVAFDAIVGNRISRALDLCVTDELDAVAVEQSAVAAGWPAFEDYGVETRPWRASNIRIDDSIIATFGVRAGAEPDSPVITTMLSCKFIVPAPLSSALSEHLTAKFGRAETFAYLEDGQLRALTLSEMLAEPSELLTGLTPNQRLVTVTTQSGEADISVFQTHAGAKP